MKKYIPLTLVILIIVLSEFTDFGLIHNFINKVEQKPNVTGLLFILYFFNGIIFASIINIWIGKDKSEKPKDNQQVNKTIKNEQSSSSSAVSNHSSISVVPVGDALKMSEQEKKDAIETLNKFYAHEMNDDIHLPNKPVIPQPELALNPTVSVENQHKTVEIEAVENNSLNELHNLINSQLHEEINENVDYLEQAADSGYEFSFSNEDIIQTVVDVEQNEDNAVDAQSNNDSDVINTPSDLFEFNTDAYLPDNKQINEAEQKELTEKKLKNDELTEQENAELIRQNYTGAVEKISFKREKQINSMENEMKEIIKQMANDKNNNFNSAQ